MNEQYWGVISAVKIHFMAFETNEFRESLTVFMQFNQSFTFGLFEKLMRLNS